MDMGSTLQEPSRGLVLPQTREDPFNITMEVTITMEEVLTTIVAPRMGMGMRMEETTVRIVPTHQPQPRET